MSEIERAAEHSIARGVGFGALAIALTVAGLAGMPHIALKAGAALTLLMWAILRFKAARALRRPYRRTEVWLMLEPRPSLPDDVAQRLIGEALKACSERYARIALAAALVMWVASFIVPNPA